MQESSKPLKKRGPPPFKPTAAQRKLVSLYAAGGIAEPSIAAEIGICQNTLRKHFEVELRTGNEHELIANLQRLRKAADKGNVGAMKYLDAKFALVSAAAAPTKKVVPVVRPPKLGKKEQARIEAQKKPDSDDWSSILQ